MAKNIAIKVIKKTLEKYSFELVFLEFAQNHFHLIIRTVDDVFFPLITDDTFFTPLAQGLFTAVAVGFAAFFTKRKRRKELLAYAPRVALFVAQLIWLRAFDPRIAGTHGTAS